MKRLIAAVLTATTMTLAACTATGGPDPSTTSDAETTMASSAAPLTAGSSTPDPVESWLRGTTTTSTPSTGFSSLTTLEPLTPTTASTTVIGDRYDDIPVTIPATITGADLEVANQAVGVWRNAMRVIDESLKDPAGKDWKPLVYRYVNDPAALKQMALINMFIKQGIHQVGDIAYTAVVFEANEHNVKIRACLDLTKSDVVGDDGNSVTQTDGPQRIRRDYWLGYFQGSDNLYVGLVDIPDPAQPC